jgi:hypothetical protein
MGGREMGVMGKRNKVLILVIYRGIPLGAMQTEKAVFIIPLAVKPPRFGEPWLPVMLISQEIVCAIRGGNRARSLGRRR